MVDVYQKIIDIEAYFNSIDPSKRIIVNDYNFFSNADRELIKSHSRTHINEDVISLIPQCACGELKGSIYKGETCKICSTEVEMAFEDFKSKLWLKKIDGVEGFISPYFIVLMDNTLGLGRSLVRWFGDNQYNPPYNNNKIAKTFESIKNIDGFQRNYSWFVNNIEVILMTISTNTNKNKSAAIMEIIQIYRDNKDNIISNYLPIVNKRFIITENTNKGKYINNMNTNVNDMLLSFMKYARSKSSKMKNKVTAKVCAMAASLSETIVKDILSEKPGVSRKQLFGMRAHFSARAVIIPMIGKHRYDEVLLPWGIGLTMMRPHIINVLMRDGKLTIKQIDSLLYGSIHQYNPLVDNALKTLVAESINGEGIPLWIHRNPSQNSESIQIVKCIGFKSKVEDSTISFSTMTMVLENGDVDGDELNVKLIEDEKLLRLLAPLKPHNAVTSVADAPGKLFGKVNIPSTTISTISSRIEHERRRLRG